MTAAQMREEEARLIRKIRRLGLAIRAIIWMLVVVWVLVPLMPVIH